MRFQGLTHYSRLGAGDADEHGQFFFIRWLALSANAAHNSALFVNRKEM